MQIIKFLILSILLSFTLCSQDIINPNCPEDSIGILTEELIDDFSNVDDIDIDLSDDPEGGYDESGDGESEEGDGESEEESQGDGEGGKKEGGSSDSKKDDKSSKEQSSEISIKGDLTSFIVSNEINTMFNSGISRSTFGGIHNKSLSVMSNIKKSQYSLKAGSTDKIINEKGKVSHIVNVGASYSSNLKGNNNFNTGFSVIRPTKEYGIFGGRIGAKIYSENSNLTTELNYILLWTSAFKFNKQISISPEVVWIQNLFKFTPSSQTDKFCGCNLTPSYMIGLSTNYSITKSFKLNAAYKLYDNKNINVIHFFVIGTKIPL